MLHQIGKVLGLVLVFVKLFIDIGRSNKLSQKYSDARVELCKEFDDVKAIDLWTALQQKDDWLTSYLLYGWNPFNVRGKQDCGEGNTEGAEGG
ncbi:hypothetical protein DM860_017295 [Cuscuta australis]|uniref:Uncharacterized protein n=1 Tax=Cuscuta australis TaxID=267555 RepID=A0A328E688_9ASTE|nr:hypothetical protein DM860_017295 [Cuscuta australis]